MTSTKQDHSTSRTVPGAVDVMGVALVGATVTVNGPTPAAYRKGEYFRKQLTVANTDAPVWQQVDVTATGETPVTRHELVSRTPEAFTPDADGNLLTDGRWTYTWDAENRLVKVESLTTNPTASKRRVTWEFDAQGRRIRQTTYDGSSGSYVVTEDLKLVYDGWRYMAELNAANNTRLRSFIWGLDLSGTQTSAGGVGGLLMVNSVANGALVKATDGTVSANYEYGPFGEPIRATGTMAKENAFRFSTKRKDNTTDLVLYEFRLYNPNTGRWLSRDPLEEKGGRNLYHFNYNDAVGHIDTDGKQSWPTGSFLIPCPPGGPGTPDPSSPPAGLPISHIRRLPRTRRRWWVKRLVRPRSRTRYCLRIRQWAKASASSGLLITERMGKLTQYSATGSVNFGAYSARQHTLSLC